MRFFFPPKVTLCDIFSLTKKRSLRVLATIYSPAANSEAAREVRFWPRVCFHLLYTHFFLHYFLNWEFKHFYQFHQIDRKWCFFYSIYGITLVFLENEIEINSKNSKTKKKERKPKWILVFRPWQLWASGIRKNRPQL